MEADRGSSSAKEVGDQHYAPGLRHWHPNCWAEHRPTTDQCTPSHLSFLHRSTCSTATRLHVLIQEQRNHLHDATEPPHTKTPLQGVSPTPRPRAAPVTRGP